MKQVCRKIAVFLFAVALMAPASLLAQKDEKEKEKEKEVKEKKEAEQIIITRKGDKNEKVVVEINGDKVTVNGKPIEELKDGEVSVRRSKIRDVWAYADGLKDGIRNNIVGSYGYTTIDSNRAMLGVTSEKTTKGLTIASVTKESAAAKIGLKKGDVIISVDNDKMDSPDDLSKAIKKHKPGDKVVVTYQRDGKEEKATAELGRYKGAGSFYAAPFAENFKENFKMDMPNIEQYMPRNRVPGQNWNHSSGQPKLGLSVQDTDDGKGVKIIEVDEESNAAKAGLKNEDVITEIDGKAVNSADEVARIIRESKDKISVMVKLQRSGKTQNIEVKMPRKLKTADL
jgi:serine protease Do